MIKVDFFHGILDFQIDGFTLSDYFFELYILISYKLLKLYGPLVIIKGQEVAKWKEGYIILVYYKIGNKSFQFSYIIYTYDNEM